MKKGDRQICRAELMIIMAALVFILLCVKPPGNVSAYLANARTAKNGLTIGENVSEIVEEYHPSSLTTGSNIFQKKVTVRNTGTVPCFVRVFLAFSDSAVADCSKLSFDADRDTGTFYTEEDFRAALNEGKNPCWVYNADDGYYYYTKPLEAGKETAPLLEWVSTFFEDTSDIRSYDIIVYEETVQTKDVDGNPIEKDQDYLFAFYEVGEKARQSGS